MSMDYTSQRQLVLKLEFSIADAVRQRGLFSVLIAAISAWADQKQNYPEVPDHLRADVGLPEVDRFSSHWLGVDLHCYRLHPPNRGSV
jgi:hypothetical protein